jgi:acetyl esterase/lipase
MPIGYLISTVVMSMYVMVALAPPRPRRSSPFRLSFMLGFLVNEVPFAAFWVLVASTWLAFAQNSVGSPVLWVGVGLAILTSIGLALIVRRSLGTWPALDLALCEGLGNDWRDEVNPEIVPIRPRLPLARILFLPFVFRRRDVERVANIRYADGGRWNRLDLYRPRHHPSDGPTLIHFHGGAFSIGRKSHEARPLLYHLASRGWTCISANYRLRGGARFPDPLIDVKKALAWVREHGREQGADPRAVFVAGSSAGAHLAAMAALTPNDPAFQPGFEGVDTSVSGAVCLYGYYGSIGGSVPSSPMSYAASDAPPFFVAHGDRDTLTIVDDARRFVERLRRSSAQPIVYAELPGGQHGFDFFHSIRFDSVVVAIEAFGAWVTRSAKERKVRVMPLRSTQKEP